MGRFRPVPEGFIGERLKDSPVITMPHVVRIAPKVCAMPDEKHESL